MYADCKLLREQGMNPKQECHDLDPDHSSATWDIILIGTGTGLSKLSQLKQL